MKKNILLKLSSAALMIAATGCLKEDAPADAGGTGSGGNPPADVVVEDPRAALVQALDTQAINLIDGINKVILTGNFVKNIAVQNPPQAIPLNTNNDVQKAIRYLLSNQTTQGNQTTYKPDPRVCSELIAKNDPAACMQLMDEVTLVQTTTDSTSGVLDLSIAGAHPFSLSYSPSSLSISTRFDEIIKTIKEISRVNVQNGHQEFDSSLPSVHEGALSLSVSNGLATSTIDFSITEAVHVAGQNQNGSPYSIQAAAAQHVASITLNSDLGIAHASISIPAVAAIFTAHDDQNTDHLVEVQFPGLNGAFNLDNALEMISVQALKLTAADAYINVDGQSAVHGIFNNQLDAEIKSSQGGNVKLSFLQQFSAQIELYTNPLIRSTGSISALVAQNTQIYFPYQNKQAKVLQGLVQLTGTQDFAGTMDAQPNTCIEGEQNRPLFLESVACEF